MSSKALDFPVHCGTWRAQKIRPRWRYPGWQSGSLTVCKISCSVSSPLGSFNKLAPASKGVWNSERGPVVLPFFVRRSPAKSNYSACQAKTRVEWRSASQVLLSHSSQQQLGQNRNSNNEIILLNLAGPRLPDGGRGSAGEIIGATRTLGRPRVRVMCAASCISTWRPFTPTYQVADAMPDNLSFSFHLIFTINPIDRSELSYRWPNKIQRNYLICPGPKASAELKSSASLISRQKANDN